MLLSTGIATLWRGFEEFGVVDTILIGGIGSIGDEISFGHDMRGMGHLTRWLTHGLWAGVVLAVGIVAEAGVLKGVFVFGAVNVGLQGAIEVDGVSFDNLSVGGRLR